MHEIHRPTFVDLLRFRQGLRLFTNDPLLRLNPQIQLELPVDSVHPLVVPVVAFHVAQEQVAQTKAPVTLIRRQPDQPIGNLGIFIAQPRLVTVKGLADAQIFAG